MTVPPPEPDPAIDPDESVPDDPAELLPDGRCCVDGMRAWQACVEL